MDLSDALGGEGGMWPGGGSNQPGGPTNPTWPAAPAQGTWPGPGGAPAQGPWPGPGGATPSAQSVSMKVPYDQTLPNGVFDKLLITINGTMKPDAKAVTMNISTSHDIAFHFTVRFNEDGKKVIVRNSEISNKWGQEERDGPFPFVPGQPFEMKVLCTSQAFRVAVNGSHLLEFRHRVKDLKSITRLSLYKDLTLTSVLVDRVP